MKGKNIMLFETVCYAEQAAAGAPMPSTSESLLGMILPLAFMFLFMYFLLIRPRRKEEKALKNKLSAMKVGDKVVSIGGIVGKIFKIKDDFIIMETGNLGTVDQKSYIKLEKTAIKDVISKITE